MLPKLQFSSYPALSVIADHSVPADRLYTIMTGKVNLLERQCLLNNVVHKFQEQQDYHCDIESPVQTGLNVPSEDAQ